MMNTATNMSALEWFFRRPSASNFPQSSSSAELRRLCDSVDQLSTALHSHWPDADEFRLLSDNALTLSKWVGKANGSDEITKDDINDLIQKLEGLVALVKRINQPKITIAVDEAINSTVIALVVLAKTSQDVGFRSKVIALAKSFSPA